MKHIIIGNFGNHSLAVLQFLIEQGLSNLHFIFVETGWAADYWKKRVELVARYASEQGLTVHSLKAQMSFSDLVIDRKEFPNPKFQWCASFLKGLTILKFLNEFDPFCEALIVSGKRQKDSRRYADLQEFEEDNDFYEGRRLWYPLWQTSDFKFTQLIKRSGFRKLSHPSLECSPCIHAHPEELAQLDAQSIKRLKDLEQQIGKTMHQNAIQEFELKRFTDKKRNLQQFDRGCGSPWGCGE